MASRVAAIALSIPLLATGCSAQEAPGSRTATGLPPYTVSEQVELGVATLPGLVSWHRDVVVTCSGGQRDVELDGCEVSTLDAAGKPSPTGIRGVRTARRVKHGILVLKANRDLVVVAPDRTERRIAELAANPGVAPEGDRLAYVQGKVPKTSIVLHHLGSGESRIATSDPTAYAPHVVPETDDVLFVSGRTGLASYFVAGADGTERQLTNIGLSQVTKGFVPLAVSQLVWIPGTRSCVFTAHYDSDVLWKLDVTNGRGKRLGPGSFPNLELGGAVLALDRGLPHVERPPRVSRYLGAGG